MVRLVSVASLVLVLVGCQSMEGRVLHQDREFCLAKGFVADSEGFRTCMDLVARDREAKDVRHVQDVIDTHERQKDDRIIQYNSRVGR